MTNDKDSAVTYSLQQPHPPTIAITANDGRPLFTIKPDGTVEGEIEDASEAARVFVESLRSQLRQPTQIDALPPHLETVCYKTSDGKRTCDRIYNITNTVPRQAVIDAVRSVPAGTICRGDAIIAAINAIPAVTFADDMVERAAHAVGQNLYVESNVEVARAVLVAALGEQMMIDIKLDINQLDGIVRAWLKETLKSVQHNAAALYVHPEDAKTYKKDVKALKRVLEYLGEDG